MKKLLSSIFILINWAYLPVYAQLTVNGYAKVTTITGTTLTLSNVNEIFDSFEDGEQIIIYQVQDTVVTDFSNTSSAGQVTNINSAGMFEVVTILSHTEIAGIPTSITLSSTPSNSYNSSATGSLQLITFPELGSPNYTTTNNISGLAWNGNIGGVVAFQVINDLILNHSIDASNLGFRGGNVSNNASRAANCTYSNIFTSTSAEYGAKGEGINKTPPSNNFTHARSNLSTGGGGGTHHNAGGGGGGNQSAGGEGGYGYNGTSIGCPATASGGGLGGNNLSRYIATTRLFLGGGGGGGQQNNGVGTSGGRGGGLLFIRAQNIVLNNCSIAISSNGQSIVDARNDGAGGGGSGGSILLDINAVQTNTTNCQLAVSTNGGNGGNSTHSRTHAGGGGGGQGAIRIRTNSMNNIVTSSTSGTGGCGQIPCNPNTRAAKGQDSSFVILLSVALETFDLSYYTKNREAVLDWNIAPTTETVNFTVERSKDAINWEISGQIQNVSNQQYYQYTDPNPLQGDSYYRIQYHTSSNQKYSPIKALYIAPSDKFAVLAPNPTSNRVTLRTIDTPIDFIQIYNLSGALVTSQVATAFHNNQTVVTLNLERLPSGVYILNTNVGLFKVQKI